MRRVIVRVGSAVVTAVLFAAGCVVGIVVVVIPVHVGHRELTVQILKIALGQTVGFFKGDNRVLVVLVTGVWPQAADGRHAQIRLHAHIVPEHPVTVAQATATKRHMWLPGTDFTAPCFVLVLREGMRHEFRMVFPHPAR